MITKSESFLYKDTESEIISASQFWIYYWMEMDLTFQLVNLAKCKCHDREIEIV